MLCTEKLKRQIILIQIEDRIFAAEFSVTFCWSEKLIRKFQEKRAAETNNLVRGVISNPIGGVVTLENFGQLMSTPDF